MTGTLTLELSDPEPLVEGPTARKPTRGKPAALDLSAHFVLRSQVERSTANLYRGLS